MEKDSLNSGEIKSEKIIKKNITTYGETPFRIYGDKKNGYLILVGDCIASPKTFATKKEAIEEIEKKNWDLLSTTILILLEKYLEMKEKTNLN